MIYFKGVVILKFFQTVRSFFILLNTKEDILKNFGKQTVDGSHSIFFFHIWKSMATVNCLVTHILQNIFFCVQQLKEIHKNIWKNMTKWFIFG